MITPDENFALTDEEVRNTPYCVIDSTGEIIDWWATEEEAVKHLHQPGSAVLKIQQFVSIDGTVKRLEENISEG